MLGVGRQIMNVNILGELYRTVVRPALMYGAGTWMSKKPQENTLEVAEIRMLRRMSGATKLDRIRTEIIREREAPEVREIAKKAQERRVNWQDGTTGI